MTTQTNWFLQTVLNLLLFSIGFKFARPEGKSGKVSLGIYYSVTDPKSLNFLKDQLKTIINSPLTQHINLTLLPFGGCKLDEDTKKLECDSGREQVQASLHHMCAIHLFNNLNGLSSVFNTDALTYVICAMEKMSESSQECADEAKGLTDEIENCLQREDQELLLKYIENTQDMNSTNFPIVIIKGTLNNAIQERNTLMKLVCAQVGPNALEMCEEMKKKEASSSGRSLGISPLYYIILYYFVKK